jgi:DNA-binding CsgD family transcriptional regulator
MHLTRREEQVIEKLLAGEKRAAIASNLAISVRTVDFHLLHVRRKIGVGSTLEAAIYLVRSTVSK